MAAWTTEQIKLAKGVNAFDYLRSTGYVLERSGKKDYQLKEHDSLKITPDGIWFWHSRGATGDAIELVYELEGISRKEAIHKLAEYAGGASVTSVTREPVKVSAKKAEFQLPEKNSTTKRAYAYLTKTRGLDEDIVNGCMKQGLIYESKQYSNVVFVGQTDDSGQVKHASLRGTYTNAAKPFKGDVTGSDKSYSFALPGKSDLLVVCESAIDALSHATLDKISGADWTEDHRLALGGMSDTSLERYLEKHPEINTLVLALDNDKDAVDKDGNPDNHGQKRAEKLAEVYKAKGYKVLNAVTKEKDLNAELQVRRGILPVASAHTKDSKMNETGEQKTAPHQAANMKQKKEPEEIEIRESNPHMDELWVNLDAGVKAVYTSKNYLNYLKFAAQFYHYSVANCMLIAMQMPKATKVAGRVAWQKNFARTVNKGEKGLQILAPVKYKEKEPREVINKDTGEITVQNMEVEKKYFKPVYVFDVTQTDGKELPQLTEELKGDVKQYEMIMAAIGSVSKYPIIFEKMENSRKGYFSPIQNKIAIREGMSQAQNLKTAIHELAHSRLHVDDRGLIDHQSKTTQEIQAESVAFIVCEHFGLDTSDYSFPYIASYENQDVKELKESLHVIQQESKWIIKDLNHILEKSMEKGNFVTEKSVTDSPVSVNEQKKEPAKSEPDIGDRESYIMNLFREGYQKDPMQAMKVFGYPVEETSLNNAILFKDPLIWEAIKKSASAKHCILTIRRQVDAGNALKGKVKVQINFSEANLPKGEFYSLTAANKIFETYEARVRKEREIDPNRGYDKTQFALYIESDGIWKHGISRYDIGDGYAENLMDFIRKSMYPDIVKVCEKEVKTQQKKIENQKMKSTKEEKEHV